MHAIAALMLILMQVTIPVDDELQLRQVRSDDGSELVVSITRQQADAVPPWNPEDKQVVPLAMDLAISLSRDSIKARHPSVEEFQVTSIEMSRLHAAYIDRWYYVINFRPLVEGRPLLGGLYMSFVLMDGTVVEPKTGAP